MELINQSSITFKYSLELLKYCPCISIKGYINNDKGEKLECYIDRERKKKRKNPGKREREGEKQWEK